ncbi:glycosyl transferase family 1 [Bacteroidia bacterium]|nr:glycosyl transferase family 1 [Bacteroidia bacterium]
MMNIGFDAKRAVQNNTGLGNYSRYIIEVLSEYYSENRYVLFAPREKANNRLASIFSRKNIFSVFPSGLSKFIPSLWREWGINRDIKKNDISIFHGLSNELPIGVRRTGIKTIVSIHDLIFLRYPQYYNLIDRLIYRIKFKRACLKSDKIIAVSECTKRDIISFFNVPEEKIKVVYQGCHKQFKTPVSEEKRRKVLEKHKLPSRYLLYVGSIETRKNLLLAVQALTRLPDDIHLVAIGKSTPYQSKINTFARKANLTSRIHIKNDFPFEDLPSVYQSASLFIYPSFFEGFGIPIIEALSSGVPVIAAKGSCLEEAGGHDSVYVNPTDPQALSEKIQEVLSDPAIADAMSEKGKKYVQRFSDEVIASDIMAVYQSLFA